MIKYFSSKHALKYHETKDARKKDITRLTIAQQQSQPRT